MRVCLWHQGSVDDQWATNFSSQKKEAHRGSWWGWKGNCRMQIVVDNRLCVRMILMPHISHSWQLFFSHNQCHRIAPHTNHDTISIILQAYSKLLTPTPPFLFTIFNKAVFPLRGEQFLVLFMKRKNIFFCNPHFLESKQMYAVLEICHYFCMALSTRLTKNKMKK